jgi:RNA polymerase sigma-70 factor, ECF subfamily
MTPKGELTQLISLWNKGDKAAEGKLFELLYGDLRDRARAILFGERDENSLGPSGLVNEAYLRFERMGAISIEDRHHFLRFAAHVMRQIVIDRARARHARKRGSEFKLIPQDEHTDSPTYDRTFEILLVAHAMSDLKALSPRQEQVVEMRYFAGYSLEETALLLGLSSRTVKRDFEVARARLRLAIEGDESAKTTSV